MAELLAEVAVMAYAFLFLEEGTAGEKEEQEDAAATSTGWAEECFCGDWMEAGKRECWAVGFSEAQRWTV